ncbi:hypothetical protein [Corallococcus sp. EGB]|uniref:hypothetical protein n=1 Tax=Corallococcus sp. EGB TaxID=1521117 RepID=UPI001CC0A069|nr:hypothetical protein [Corallococcus sp. EGB]
MPVERVSGGTSLVDVLDRLLDRGLRFDTQALEALCRTASRDGEARIVVAFSEVRTADSLERGRSPRPPLPGA